MTVPPGATALVDLPGAAPVEAGSGTHSFSCPFRDAADDPAPVAIVHPFAAPA
ncbi:hypothetical protein OHA72_25320 [Dactylosporangium sp. NBC_01737]|uniref:hypothetical protein n=1 Tax=Dactylosporangium sp. NBC_01737 TaxID=2975959 RepID=UPI002E14D9AC|nr:hypothetical protein OHA72_25320 [Dactylosporangium sp. NBC_01737]